MGVLQLIHLHRPIVNLNLRNSLLERQRQGQVVQLQQYLMLYAALASFMKPQQDNTQSKLEILFHSLASLRKWNSNPHQMSLQILENTRLLLHADRATLYLVEQETNELVSKSDTGVIQIRLPLNKQDQGIA